MLDGKRIAVVLPAYNAARTLQRTVDEIPREIVDFLILTDDKSSDDTMGIAKSLPIEYIIAHDRNRGYGANQKTCYDKALSLGADIIVMLHPDYQYTPRLISPMCSLIASGMFDAVLGSRILGKGALKGGMPLYKYIANRALTFVQNILLNHKLSEFHTGFRAYSRKVLEKIDYTHDSDSYKFDNQLLAQIIYHGFEIGEIACPTQYSNDSSSISLKNSIIYGFGVLQVSLLYFLDKNTPMSFRMFAPRGAGNAQLKSDRHGK